MKFSLIMGTLGRDRELEAFLQSLIGTKVNFELIIVDQNSNGLIDKIIETYNNKFTILHIKTDIKGLSHARNIGLQHASGDIICFPDDDCVYSENLLDNVYSFFMDNIDTDICTIAVNRKQNKIITINTFNMFNYHISFSIFIRNKRNNDIYFNESLGCGAKYGSSEETELLVRLLFSNYKCKFWGSCVVYHPSKKEVNYSRAYSYALGAGRFHYLALLTSSSVSNKIAIIYIILLSFLKSSVKFILSLFLLRFNKVKETFIVLKGRWYGFFSFFDK